VGPDRCVALPELRGALQGALKGEAIESPQPLQARLPQLRDDYLQINDQLFKSHAIGRREIEISSLFAVSDEAPHHRDRCTRSRCRFRPSSVMLRPPVVRRGTQSISGVRRRVRHPVGPWPS